jgi:hypothetical protein
MFVNSRRQTVTFWIPSQVVRGTAVLFIFALLLVGCQAAQTGTTVPPDVPLVAEVDLSDHAYDEEILGTFTLAETAVVTIYYTIPNLNTAGFDLSLNDQNDNSLVILHSEDYRTDENGGGTWEKSLTPGTYRLALTAEQSEGILSVYWENPSKIN